MNVTFSADRELLDRARLYARYRGTSLNKLFREFLEEVAADVDCEEAAEEFAFIARTMPGNSQGRAWPGRDALYADRLKFVRRGAP